MTTDAANEMNQPSYIVPSNYIFTDRGIQLKKWNNKKEEYIFETISNCPIHLSGVAKDIDTGALSFEVTYTTPMGETYSGIYGMNELTTSKIKNTKLGSHINLTDSQTVQVNSYLNSAITENARQLPLTKMANKFGWRSEKAYIIGSKLISDKGIETVRSEQNTEKYEPIGKLEDWIDAVKPVIDDPTVRIKCYGAIAAPLLKLLNVQSFLLDHYGATSRGKHLVPKLQSQCLATLKPY